MKSYLRTSGLLFNQPLMVTPDVLELGVRWANQVMNLNIINLGPATAPAMRMDDNEGSAPRAQGPGSGGRGSTSTGVAVIPVHGVLVPRSANLEMCETMTSYEGLRRDIRAAVNDPAIERIALDIDSPGGSVAGAFELADDIRAMAAQKPITGVINFMGYSGGYLIASACSDIVVSRTSGVGSIGVIASHMDRTALNEKLGVKVTTVYAGAHKNDLTPHEPISEQSLKVLTDLVNEGYDMFVSAVADYRSMTATAVRATEAGLYRGDAAIKAGLADRLQSPQDAIDGIAHAVATDRAQRSASRISVRAAALQIQSQL